MTTIAIDTTNLINLQEPSVAIWEQKYQSRDILGNNIDLVVLDTYIRVAKRLASVEKDPEYWEPIFLQSIIDGAYPAGRILANAGAEEHKNSVSLINCLVSDGIEDNIESIMERLSESAISLKHGCGIGYDWSSLRPDGANIQGVGTSSSGPLSFMNIYDTMCFVIRSAGGRRGAQMGTLRVDHPDIMSFIDTKSEEGVLRQFNLSVLITNEFIEAVAQDSDWNFKWQGENYGEPIKARTLWEKITRSTYEIAEPGFLMIDQINLKNNNWFCEVITATNPCGEQPLPPKGACLLGSINLVLFVVNPFTPNAYFDSVKFCRTVKTFARMLDNVVEISGLPLDKQIEELVQKRRHGMGYTGLGSALTMLGIKYGSDDAVEFTSEVTRGLAIFNLMAGVELAKEKGMAPILKQFFQVKSLPDSPMKNRLIESLAKINPQTKVMGLECWMKSDYFEWLYDSELLKEDISLEPNKVYTVDDLVTDLKTYGCRFTHMTSIAPTGTMSASIGNNCSSGIEPTFAHYYTRNRIVEGKNTKEAMDVYSAEYLLYRKLNGDVPIDKLPDYFVTTDDVHWRDHIRMQAAAQLYIDSSVSKTINVPQEISYEEFQGVYTEAVKAGLKGCTTYRPNPEKISAVLVRKSDQAKTTYTFKLEDGSEVTARADETILYEGQTHNVENLAQSIREGVYSKF